MVLPEWLKPPEGDQPQPADETPATEDDGDGDGDELVDIPEADEISEVAETVEPTATPEAPNAVATEPPDQEQPQPEPAPASGADDQVLEMLAAIQQRLSQLDTAQRDHDEQLSSLLEDVKTRHQALESPAEVYPDSDGGLGDLDEGQLVSMADRAAELTEREAELDQREEELEKEHERLEELAEQLNAAKPGDDIQSRLDDAQAEIAELTEKAIRAQTELQGRTEELAASVAQVETLETRIAEVEQPGQEGPEHADDDRVEALTEEIETLKAEIEARDDAITDLREQLSSRPRGDAPAGDDAGGPTGEMVERQRRQIERLTEQLSAFKSGDDPEEIRSRDARIAELEEQLESVQGEKGMAKLVAGFGGALQKVKRKGGAEGGADANLVEQVEELTAECERLREELDQMSGDAPPPGGDAAVEVTALRAQVRQLQKELDSRDAAPAPAPRSKGKGKSKTKDDAPLKKRIKELEEALAEARDKPTRSRDSVAKAQELQSQERVLQKKQESLASVEREMMRKWARPKATIIYGYLVGIAIVVAVASGLAANHFFPATVAASVNIQAKTDNGRPISASNADKWWNWHTTLLSEEAFHKLLAKRLSDQRLEKYDTPAAIGRRIAADLTVDSPSLGELIITLAGSDPHEVTAILDTVATQLSLESRRQAGKRSDDAVAVVRGERRDKNGRVRYSTLNPAPIKDRRLIAGMIFFVFGLVISVFLIIKIAKSLVAARQAVSEEEIEPDALF